jgi:hypothetical protein
VRWTHRERRSLAAWYADDGTGRMVSREVPSPDELKELSRIQPQENSPWSLRMIDGVLVVTNQLSFLDRSCAAPMAPLLALERQLGPAAQRSSPPVLTWEALRAYCRAAGTSRSMWWGVPEGEYRGLPMKEITVMAPFLRLLDRLAPAARTAVWRGLRSKKEARVPLGGLAPADLASLIAALRALGPETPASWHPAAGEQLRQCAVTVQVIGDDNLSPPGTIGLSLDVEGFEFPRTQLFGVRPPRGF